MGTLIVKIFMALMALIAGAVILGATVLTIMAIYEDIKQKMKCRKKKTRK